MVSTVFQVVSAQSVSDIGSVLLQEILAAILHAAFLLTSVLFL